jgi:hypothetical protein
MDEIVPFPSFYLVVEGTFHEIVYAVVASAAARMGDRWAAR